MYVSFINKVIVISSLKSLKVLFRIDAKSYYVNYVKKCNKVSHNFNKNIAATENKK